MLSEQPIELVFDHPVTLADSPFQLLAVDDLHVSANVTNSSAILQAAGSHGHAFAANAQHVGYQFLGHNQLVGLHPIVA